MIAMMIDIETLSLRPEAFVMQVGVCVASLETGQMLYAPENYWLSQYDQEDRHIDFKTVCWWTQQDRKVTSQVLDTPDGISRISVAKLYEYFAWFNETYPDMTVWAAPAAFDLAVLFSLFQGNKPWSYRQERCLSTLAREIDPLGTLKPENPKEHDAASDAATQMAHLIKLYPILRSVNVAR